MPLALLIVLAVPATLLLKVTKLPAVPFKLKLVTVNEFAVLSKEIVQG